LSDVEQASQERLSQVEQSLLERLTRIERTFEERLAAPEQARLDAEERARRTEAELEMLRAMQTRPKEL